MPIEETHEKLQLFNQGTRDYENELRDGIKWQRPVAMMSAILGTLAIGTANTETALASRYETPQVQAHKAWVAEAKELKKRGIFDDLTPYAKRRCSSQLKKQPRSYSSCMYPVRYEQITQRAKHSKKVSIWLGTHVLRQPGHENMSDRQKLYFYYKPAQKKELLQEIKAGVFYKSPNRWLWRKVNLNECSGRWTCNTGNGYYGGLQMDDTFEHTYNPIASKKWGHANNWPINSQIFAADRAYHGFWNISARGLVPWPWSNRHYGRYPVPANKVDGYLGKTNPDLIIAK